MKMTVISLILAMVLVLSVVTPVLADAPTMESWGAGGSGTF